MYRTVIEKLKEWKKKKDRLPIILLGARQVGKTWLMKEFGRFCFADVCYRRRVRFTLGAMIGRRRFFTSPYVLRSRPKGGNPQFNIRL